MQLFAVMDNLHCGHEARICILAGSQEWMTCLIHPAPFKYFTDSSCRRKLTDITRDNCCGIFLCICAGYNEEIGQ